ncbi:hypothetical protein [Lysobacter xanthus]
MRSPSFRCYACALLLAVAAPLAAAPARLTADTPPLPDALSPAEVAAIVAEADAVLEPQRTYVKRLPATWRTLDRDRLLALMRMPDFATTTGSAHGLLMNQAGTWDLFGWQRPSDAARLWERIWPRSRSSDPTDPPNGYGLPYWPDPTWSTHARAMTTLFACLPDSAWRSTGDPLVEALRTPVSFQWQNHYGWSGFHDCVPDGAFDEETRPDAAGLAELRGFLADRLAGELYVDGCTRRGVEDCLFLLHALTTLAPHDPRLPALVKRLASSFDLDASIAEPDVSADRMGELADADRATLLAAYDRVARRSLFLTHEIRVIAGWPGAWPAGVLDEAVMRATDAGVLRARIERRFGWRSPMVDREYDDPWAPLDAATRRRLAPRLRAAGQDYAQTYGCASDRIDKRVPAEFDDAARRVRGALHCD